MRQLSTLDEKQLITVSGVSTPLHRKYGIFVGSLAPRRGGG
jgi:hypothetical protein